MNFILKIKEWFTSKISRKMLESGEETKKTANDNFKNRIDAKGIAGLIEKYKELEKKMVELDKEENKCVTDFYDSLVEVFELGPEYSQKNLNTLENKQKNLQQSLNEINAKLDKDGIERWESELYQEVSRENIKVKANIASIKSELSNCMKKMEEEYEKNPLKFNGARQIYLHLAKVVEEKYKAFASSLAIEYSMLEKITQQGDMTSEQKSIIETVFNKKIVGGNVQTYIGKRMSRILECMDQNNGGLSSNLIDDGGKFHKVEAIFNDIISKKVYGAFEETRKEASSSLSEKNVDFEAIAQLYSIFGNEWGIFPKDKSRSQARENARQYE